MKAKKFWSGVLALAMGCSMALSLSACNKGSNNASSSSQGQDLPTLSVTEFRDSVSLVYQNVLSYMEATPDSLVSLYLPGDTTRTDQSRAVGISYEWDGETEPEVESAEVQFSLTEDFSVIETTTPIKEGKSSCATYNLKTGSHYYFRVNVTLESGQTVSKTGEFDTKKSPRMIYLEGGNNVRDIGGWMTDSGKEIKQGLLYRGGEIDGGKNTGHADFCLTKTGIEQLRALGIKTDFDLRSESNKVGENSILGADVSRTFYDAFQYLDALKASNAETTRSIFSDLAKPEKYPVYLHCTHGVDRAGTTSLLLEALLGVSAEDLVRDYELSAFYYNYAHVHRNFDENGGPITKVIEELEKYEGEKLSDKTANFMLSIGVTEAEIASIRNIFLG